MQEGEPPDREIQIVGAAPEAVREPLPVPVGDREREQQFSRDDAEGCRQRTVSRSARNDQLRQREGHVRVDEQREHVDGDKRPGEQPGEPVDVLDREARPVAQLGPA